MEKQYTYTRYLSSKKTVDDRALNRHVVDCLRRELDGSHRAPLRVLEIGAGLGTMVARLLEWDLLREAEYVLLDVDRQSLADSRGWLTEWAARTGRSVEVAGEAMRVRDAARGVDVRVHLVEAELGSYLAANRETGRAHLLVANAFLDLVDVPHMLPALFDLIVPNGLYWFSINFDGDTIFEPEHPLDAPLLAVYHRSMDERVRYGRPAGDSRTGRHLFQHLRRAGASILAAGGSDWVVFGTHGHYEADEAYFLHHIIHTVDEELRAWPEVDQAALRNWVSERHAQIERGELTYIAHQTDFVGRRAG